MVQNLRGKARWSGMGRVHWRGPPLHARIDTTSSGGGDGDGEGPVREEPREEEPRRDSTRAGLRAESGSGWAEPEPELRQEADLLGPELRPPLRGPQPRFTGANSPSSVRGSPCHLSVGPRVQQQQVEARPRRKQATDA